eukprot:TRINITY_DN31320_c0_g1_i5.p1 TRINITY_DN31320_c0_g1~~TRINITY_DN31320_c0_g1_i5.p1  ORF type:complete len:506 (+),score=43.75 TRINITY_DN31320_c0_g1_i5:23-1540(+)
MVAWRCLAGAIAFDTDSAYVQNIWRSAKLSRASTNFALLSNGDLLRLVAVCRSQMDVSVRKVKSHVKDEHLYKYGMSAQDKYFNDRADKGAKDVTPKPMSSLAFRRGLLRQKMRTMLRLIVDTRMAYMTWLELKEKNDDAEGSPSNLPKQARLPDLSGASGVPNWLSFDGAFADALWQFIVQFLRWGESSLTKRGFDKDKKSSRDQTVKSKRKVYPSDDMASWIELTIAFENATGRHAPRKASSGGLLWDDCQEPDTLRNRSVVIRSAFHAFFKTIGGDPPYAETSMDPASYGSTTRRVAIPGIWPAPSYEGREGVVRLMRSWFVSRNAKWAVTNHRPTYGLVKSLFKIEIIKTRRPAYKPDVGWFADEKGVMQWMRSKPGLQGVVDAQLRVDSSFLPSPTLPFSIMDSCPQIADVVSGKAPEIVKVPTGCLNDYWQNTHDDHAEHGSRAASQRCHWLVRRGPAKGESTWWSCKYCTFCITEGRCRHGSASPFRLAPGLACPGLA